MLDKLALTKINWQLGHEPFKMLDNLVPVLGFFVKYYNVAH